MNRLGLVTQTVRARVNDLAEFAPDWLRALAPQQWYERYARRIEESRLPKSEAARESFAEQVGQDGLALLDALADAQTPAGIAELPAVQTLRQLWQRHYERDEAGRALWRAGPDLSRAASAIESPYDIGARHSTKRDTVWTGYKAHLTETCDPGLPRLITNVHTTVATTQDVTCTQDIHQRLEGKSLLPGVHLVDTGYVDGELLVESKQRYAVTLLGPPRDDKSWQAREGGYDQSRFHVDRDRERVTCPGGKISAWWGVYLTKPYGSAVVKARFDPKDCAGCAQREKYTRSCAGSSRTLSLPPRPQCEALLQARARLASEEGRTRYRQRAGVEGTLWQGVRRSDLRHARYHGLIKTHLQHALLRPR